MWAFAVFAKIDEIRFLQITVYLSDNFIMRLP
jgi:hypothetical protein